MFKIFPKKLKVNHMKFNFKKNKKIVYQAIRMTNGLFSMLLIISGVMAIFLGTVYSVTGGGSLFGEIKSVKTEPLTFSIALFLLLKGMAMCGVLYGMLFSQVIFIAWFVAPEEKREYSNTIDTYR